MFANLRMSRTHRGQSVGGPSAAPPARAKRERQARVVASGLDRIDGLAGDVQLVGQGALAPAVSLAQRLEVVQQRFWPTTDAPTQPSIPAA